ncbi:hypothetical protein FA95DRAFT_1450152, partial [Auriscalpium vulgare]
DAQDCTIPDLFISLLTSRRHVHRTALDIVISQLDELLEALRTNTRTAKRTSHWVCKTSAAFFSRSISTLTQKSNGWHFSAIHASPAQIREFQIRSLADNIQNEAPELWDLVGAMLSKDALVQRRDRSAPA